MTADKPSRLVPKLRFSEFRDAGEWGQTPLRDAFKTITNGKANAQDHQDDGTYPLFDRSEVVKRSPIFLFDAEAVILPGEGMRFQPRYFNGKFNLHQRAYALMEPTVDPRFAFHALDRFNGVLAGRAVKSTVLSLRLPIIENFDIPCPANEGEQKKIADCLGSLDDLIAAKGRKLETLRQHKQGLMQQLFPQPGETVPRLRFPEFRDAGEWEPRTLERIGKFIGGGTPSTSTSEYWGGDIQWFTPSEINERKLSKSKRTITRKGLKNSSAKLLPTGALLITTRATIGDVGIAENPCATNQGFQSFVVFEHEVNVFYYYWLVQHKHELIRHSSGSTFLEVGKTELKQIPAFRPNKDEQRKIADCLGSLDDLIAVEEQKLETLRQHKQGLMQQLFPSMDGQ